MTCNNMTTVILYENKNDDKTNMMNYIAAIGRLLFKKGYYNDNSGPGFMREVFKKDKGKSGLVIRMAQITGDQHRDLFTIIATSENEATAVHDDLVAVAEKCGYVSQDYQRIEMSASRRTDQINLN